MRRDCGRWWRIGFCRFAYPEIKISGWKMCRRSATVSKKVLLEMTDSLGLIS